MRLPDNVKILPGADTRRHKRSHDSKITVLHLLASVPFIYHALHDSLEEYPASRSGDLTQIPRLTHLYHVLIFLLRNIGYNVMHLRAFLGFFVSDMSSTNNCLG